MLQPLENVYSAPEWIDTRSLWLILCHLLLFSRRAPTECIGFTKHHSKSVAERVKDSMSLKCTYSSPVYVNNCACTQPCIFLQKGISNFYGSFISSAVENETLGLDFMNSFLLTGHINWEVCSSVFVNDSWITGCLLDLKESFTLSSSLVFFLNRVSGIVILTETG